MGAPYTPDLRERVVATFRSGMSRAETAALFRVSESSVQRWSRLARTTGSVAAQPMGGQRPFALAGERRHQSGRNGARTRAGDVLDGPGARSHGRSRQAV